MEQSHILAELEEIVKSLGLTIRFEKGEFKGGDCILYDRNLVVMNKKTPVPHRISLLARVVGLYGGEELYVKPLIRQIVDEEMTKYHEEIRQYHSIPSDDTDAYTHTERTES